MNGVFMQKQLKDLKQELNREVKENILAYWQQYSVDHQNEGFYGRVNENNEPDIKADKGCILNSRILWTFSAAYLKDNDTGYLDVATRARNYLFDHFHDKDFSGLYWSVDFKGRVVDSKKHMYNIAFGIYGLSEYYKATQDDRSLALAIELYGIIEKYSYDNVNRGYIEAFGRAFDAIENMALSDKDMNEKKSMNTHLHIMEAYTNLLRVWDDARLKTRLKELIHVFMEKIIDSDTGSQKLFFDENWNSKCDTVSYGHDIEASWLLYEAACVLGDSGIMDKVQNASLKLSENVLKLGIDQENDGLFDEKDGDTYTSIKSWWPQTEALVGFMYAFLISKDERYLKASCSIWNFIKSNFIDKEKGEWFEAVDGSGHPVLGRPKVSEWKCPYHNTRALLEVMDIVDRLEDPVESKWPSTPLSLT
jgi:mannobiose 2-epimerase